MIDIMSKAIESLFSQGREAQVPIGTLLFLTGDVVDRVTLVRSGSVGLRRISELGHEMLLQTARTGDVLAEASVYSSTYHCDGIALENSNTTSVPVSLFRARLNADPEAHAAWAKYLARGVQIARSKAEIRGLKTVAARVDMWLTLNNQLPEKGQRRLLAAELGVSPEALYRELAKRPAS
jgi:CRP-like cAMP-binding protein